MRLRCTDGSPVSTAIPRLRLAPGRQSQVSRPWPFGHGLAIAPEIRPRDPRSHRYGYHGQQPTRVLADLVTDFTTLRPLLTVPQPAPIRARLCRTAGQMTGMTAIVLHDLGSRRESRALSVI